MGLVGRTLWTRCSGHHYFRSRLTWASAADQGVRPTLRSKFSRVGALYVHGEDGAAVLAVGCAY
jgi:hypothetical protein